jgi:tyrosyl-tRNA synthetase
MVSSVPKSLSPLSDSEIRQIAAQHRLKLTPLALQEMIASAYTCLYHEEEAAAKQALEAIHLRAQFDGTAQVLMVEQSVCLPAW